MGIWDTISNFQKNINSNIKNIIGGMAGYITGIPNQYNPNVKYEQKIADRDWAREQQAMMDYWKQQQSSAKTAMDFEASQAAINRAFQQTSAEKAMNFEAAQAELNRNFQQQSANQAMEWSAQQNKQAQMWEALEAEKMREYQTSSAREAMQWEADQAAIQRQYQQEMSDTSYQRAVKDLKAAGLNPILAALNGGASTASGAMGSGFSSSGAMGSGFAGSPSSASGAMASGKSASGSKGSGAKASSAKAYAVKGIYNTSTGLMGDIISSVTGLASKGISALAGL